MNDEWGLSFPSAVASFGLHDFSDHAPICVRLDTPSPAIKRPFRFFNFLLQSSDFLPLIAVNWFSFNVTRSAMLRVSKKLKLLKKPIRDFSRQNFSGIELRTREAHESLLLAQDQMLASPTVANAEKELECCHKWQILSKAEESFFMQRSFVSWLENEDSNTPYYHRLVASRRSANHIHSLMDDSGAKIDSQAGIEDHCVGYFSNLLGGSVSQTQF